MGYQLIIWLSSGCLITALFETTVVGLPGDWENHFPMLMGIIFTWFPVFVTIEHDHRPGTRLWTMALARRCFLPIVAWLVGIGLESALAAFHYVDRWNLWLLSGIVWAIIIISPIRNKVTAPEV